MALATADPAIPSGLKTLLTLLDLSIRAWVMNPVLRVQVRLEKLGHRRFEGFPSAQLAVAHSHACKVDLDNADFFAAKGCIMHLRRAALLVRQEDGELVFFVPEDYIAFGAVDLDIYLGPGWREGPRVRDVYHAL